MRNRLLLCLICGALPFASLMVRADDSAPGPSESASLKITFTVPERVEVAARLTTDDRETSSACLTTRGSSAFAVNALVQEGSDWQLAPVNIMQDDSAHECDDDLSLRLDLDTNWYAANGMMTLLVSPL